MGDISSVDDVKMIVVCREDMVIWLGCVNKFCINL